MRYSAVLGAAAPAGVLCLASLASAAITIDTVHVGNPGNTADTRYDTTGYGSVSYAYDIGTYEVTAGQYTAFLNAVAATDTYSLYNTSMSDTSYGSGITRSGSSGGYSYTVDPAFVNRPVNYVSFWDATRFANWLSNGQPTGAQDNTTTEDGAYTLTTTGIDNNTITRNANAKWVVTGENEWYKAAYYDPTLNGGSGGYYDYPTSSDTAPGRDLADVSGNNANYYGDPYPIDSGKYTTVAGEFQNSDSPYGTFDQCGNVWEWNEAIITELYRGLRGGSFSDVASNLAASHRDSTYPYNESYLTGFRVASLPEPGSCVMVLCLASAALMRRRRCDESGFHVNVAEVL